MSELDDLIPICHRINQFIAEPERPLMAPVRELRGSFLRNITRQEGPWAIFVSGIAQEHEHVYAGNGVEVDMVQLAVMRRVWMIVKLGVGLDQAHAIRSGGGK